MHYLLRLLCAAAALSAVSMSFSQDDQQRRRTPPTDPQAPTPRPQTGTAPGGPQRAGGFGQGTHQPPKPYEEVITKDAKTQGGLFKVHQIRDQILFEIPKSLFNRELLMSVQVVRTPPGQGGLLAAGMPAAQAIVEFEKRNDQLL